MSLGECREALPSPLWLASGATLRRPPLRGNQPGARALAAAFVRPVVGCRVLLEESTAPRSAIEAPQWPRRSTGSNIGAGSGSAMCATCCRSSETGTRGSGFALAARLPGAGFCSCPRGSGSFESEPLCKARPLIGCHDRAFTVRG